LPPPPIFNYTYPGLISTITLGEIMKQTHLEALAKEYSFGEELVNSITHGFGTIFGIIALVLMLLRAIDMQQGAVLASAIIYGTSIILLFLASTLYHAIPYQTAKQFFKKVDHAAIYLMIAGSYTPYLLITLKGVLSPVWPLSVWGLAVIGVFYKLFFIHKFRRLGLISYLGMGWISIMIIRPLYSHLELWGFLLLFIGGLIYSLGVFFYVADNKIPYNHSIWHFFVLGGSVTQFFSIYKFVMSGR